MRRITGDHARTGGSRVDEAGVAALALADLPDPDAGTSEQRLADALRRCVARWGLAKTTIEDIAREAGTSRATVYRLCPGGKYELLELGAWSDVRRLVDEVSGLVDAADDLEQALTSALHAAMCFLEDHDALRFIREHEPVVFEQFLDFERVEQALRCAGDLLAPSFGRFLEPEASRAAPIWLARLVLSHLQTPSPVLDLTDRAAAERLVRTFVLPGLRPVIDVRAQTPSTDVHHQGAPSGASTT